jgi:L-amino acid N-acyltransferase YncA
MNPAPRYRGIGSILVRAAIELSKQEEFKGRIGLHSLPQADSFYSTTCGMSDLGVEAESPYAPMRYFEMTSEQAEAFIKKGQKP